MQQSRLRIHKLCFSVRVAEHLRIKKLNTVYYALGSDIVFIIKKLFINLFQFFLCEKRYTFSSVSNVLIKTFQRIRTRKSSRHSYYSDLFFFTNAFRLAFFINKHISFVFSVQIFGQTMDGCIFKQIYYCYFSAEFLFQLTCKLNKMQRRSAHFEEISIIVFDWSL